MRRLERPHRWFRITVLSFLLVSLGVTLSPISPSVASRGSSLGQDDFAPAAPQGFGDRQNSWTWSMTWWKGNLYVGTNRAWHCVEAASFHQLFPDQVPYPPTDPDVECTQDPEDLPLQAEIWRWTPGTETWDRVYQSPNDLTLPSGKPVARDSGYRGMAIFDEADGSQALYVTGVSPRSVYGMTADLPPPRILRSTDGVNFAPVPQVPGTTLGDFLYSSLRSPVSYNGRLYIVGGIAQGSGILLESADPASGDFREVGPPGWGNFVSSVQTFNGYLYVGTHNLSDGYAVLKTNASGELPYTYTTVVGSGGYLAGEGKNTEVLDMEVFNDQLYAGCNGLKSGLGGGHAAGAELIRINPDDSWDVVVGDPRVTPDGPKFPISGLTAGFVNLYNAHMWRLEVFNGELYVGTFDSSTTFKDDPEIEPTIRHLMGFDLYRSPNGIDWVPITTTGFGDKFNFGVRALRATPYGLFLGTANYYYGLQVWRATDPLTRYRVYLPVTLRAGGTGALSTNSDGSLLTDPFFRLGPPSQVEVEVADDGNLVSWEPVLGPVQYHVFRSEIKNISISLEPKGVNASRAAAVMGQPGAIYREGRIPLPAIDVGTATASYFVDQTAVPGTHYLYHVVSTDELGRRSGSSNIVATSALSSPMTFGDLAAALAEMQDGDYRSLGRVDEMTWTLSVARTRCQDGDLVGAVRMLAGLRGSLAEDEQATGAPWKAQERLWLLDRLQRRLRLAELGLIPLSSLD